MKKTEEYKIDLPPKFQFRSVQAHDEEHRNKFPEKSKAKRRRIRKIDMERERERGKKRTMWSLKSEEGPYSGLLSPIRRRRVLQLLILIVM
jgi:hypothetical protein